MPTSKPAPIEAHAAESSIKTIASFRIATTLLHWMKAEARALGTSANAIVVQLLDDAMTWYRLPHAIVESLEADRRAMDLPRREYVMHVLLRRYEQVRERGVGFERRPKKEGKR